MESLSGREQESTRAGAGRTILVVAGACVLVVLAVTWAGLGARHGGQSLACLTPLVKVLAHAGEPLHTHAGVLILSLAALLSAATLGLALGWSWRLGLSLLLLSTASLATGTLPAAGLAMLAAGALLVAIAPREVLTAGVESARAAFPPGRGESVGLGAIVATAAVLRLWSIDRFPVNFEGELAVFYMGATSCEGALLANAGAEGPWAPMGLSMYALLAPFLAVFGQQVWAIRLAAALPSLLSVVAVWGIGRRLAGPVAAFAAASYLAIDPMQVFWGRSDIHPHGSTLFAPLLLLWISLRLADRPRSPAFLLALPLAMGLSWHTYPSGQIGVFLPFGLLMLPRGQRPQISRLAPALVLGLALWSLGAPVESYLGGRGFVWPNFLHRYGVRTAWSEDLDAGERQSNLARIASRVVSNTAVLARGVVSGPAHLSHQTVIPASGGRPERLVLWPFLALALVAAIAALRLPQLARWRILLLWAVVAAAPALLSSQPFAKRAATLFPALALLGASALAVGLGPVIETGRPRRLAAVLAAVALTVGCCWSAHAWFAHADNFARSPEEAAARALTERIHPGSIVVLVASHPYPPGIFTFLLLDRLTVTEPAPVAWFPVLPDKLEAWLSRPEAIPEAAVKEIWYPWTKLRTVAPAVAEYGDWNLLMIVVQTSVHGQIDAFNESLVALARERLPGAEVSTLDVPYHDYRFQIIAYPLAEPPSR
jgi:hypothetical protein